MEQVLFDEYNAFAAKNGNIIWAAAMQLAWNQLRQQFANNQPLTFSTQKANSLKTIRNFNQSHFKKGDISSKSIYVKSGYGGKTVDLINAEVKQKFPEKTIAPLDIQLNEKDIISYAYLFKKLIFPTKFERRNEKQFSFKQKMVESFYAKNEQQKKGVLVHNYENANNFVVQLIDKEGIDCMFLIKNEKNLRVDDAIQIAEKGSLKSGVPLAKGDRFEMPIIKIDQRREYQQMINLAFQNNELKQYFIRVMVENVKLDVNESGAKVENDAVIVASRCAVFHDNPKNVILDNDFWIVMKEKKSHPYLCVLIKNP